MYAARVKTENVVKGNIIDGKRVYNVLPVGPEGVISCVVRTRKGWGILDLTPGSLVTVKRYNHQKKVEKVDNKSVFADGVEPNDEMKDRGF